jgi:hypothetical protein
MAAAVPSILPEIAAIDPATLFASWVAPVTMSIRFLLSSEFSPFSSLNAFLFWQLPINRTKPKMMRRGLVRFIFIGKYLNSARFILFAVKVIICKVCFGRLRAGIDFVRGLLKYQDAFTIIDFMTVWHRVKGVLGQIFLKYF